MAVLFTDRRGPIVPADADAAYALAVKLASDTGKPVKVLRRVEASIDYLVTSEPDLDGWQRINLVHPTA